MSKYRNARVKYFEILLIFTALPVFLATIPMAILWKDNSAFIMTFALIYGLICFNTAFLVWDTKKVAHTIIFTETGVTLQTRGGEESFKWKDIDDLLWKKVVSKRSVVGLFMKDGSEKWLKSVNPLLAEKMKRAWQEWKKV